MISYKKICEKFTQIEDPSAEIVFQKMKKMDGMSMMIFIASMILAVYVNLLICQYLWNNVLVKLSPAKKATIFDILGIKFLVMFIMS